VATEGVGAGLVEEGTDAVVRGRRGSTEMQRHRVMNANRDATRGVDPSAQKEREGGREWRDSGE
jgi:hypothetical protein